MYGMYPVPLGLRCKIGKAEPSVCRFQSRFTTPSIVDHPFNMTTPSV